MMYPFQFPESTPATSAAEGAYVEKTAYDFFPSTFSSGKTNIETVTNRTHMAEKAE
jgi:hypothetical protein